MNIVLQLTYYKCHKVNSKHGGTNIDPPGQIKWKKVTVKPKN